MARKNKKRKLRDIRKTHRIRKSSGDLVTIQISAKFTKLPKGFTPSRELIENMIREKARKSSGQFQSGRVVGAKEGPNPDGVTLKIISWANPDRIKTDTGGRKHGSQADRWGSLRRAIIAGRFAVQFHRVVR
jgi:hypothetical protein